MWQSVEVPDIELIVQGATEDHTDEVAHEQETHKVVWCQKEVCCC